MIIRQQYSYKLWQTVKIINHNHVNHVIYDSSFTHSNVNWTLIDFTKLHDHLLRGLVA